MSAVTGWGCAWCSHTVVREGRARRELLNRLPGPKSSAVVCRHCVIRGLLLCLYIHMFNVLHLYCYLIHDLIVNFLLPSDVNICL